MRLPDTKGALVADVVEESPADEAKFQRGDIIRTFDGRDVENSTKLRTLVAETSPETNVQVGILRNGREKMLTVEIGQVPKDVANRGSAGTMGQHHALSGLTVESVSHGQASAERGVTVTRVDPDSRAARAGVRKDDVILEINRNRIEDVEDFDRITSQLQDDESVLVLLKRDHSTIFLSISGKE